MTFTKSYRLHLLVGLGVGTWLVLFLVFIAPFDVSDLSFYIRVKITVVYGLIFFFCYAGGILFQNFLIKKFSGWSLKLEMLLYFFLYLAVLPFTVAYYYSDIVNGDYPLKWFILEQYIPILIVITPIMYLLRRSVAKGEQMKKLMEFKDGTITFQGENKQDVLRLKPEAIIAVQSSDNYVEVSYLDNNALKKKLLRTTLKKVESQFQFLIRVHRSYLINGYHFSEWISKDTAMFNQLVVPVSKQYRDKLEELTRP